MDAANQAFVDGLGVAAITGAVVVALAAVAAWRLLPREDVADETEATGSGLEATDREFAVAD